jgi:hypothetical protein
MIYLSADDRVMCDCCGKWGDEVFLILMGDFFDRIWSYAFCKPCIMKAHKDYMWMLEAPGRSMNVVVRGQNLNVNEILVNGGPINAENAALYNLPDYAIQG